MINKLLECDDFLSSVASGTPIVVMLKASHDAGVQYVMINN